jgi:two-component system response regulator YesN
MSYNILIVDDDELFREEFREALPEFHVVEASNGSEALDLLKKPNEIDLVVLDVKMPGLSGTQVLSEIKKIAPRLGTVILTGYGTKEVAVEALRGHADDYIEKPMDMPRARGVLERLLQSRPGELNPAGDLKGKIGKLKNFLERNVDKKVSLEDAAGVVFLSPKYLSRVFKLETGMGFSEFQQQLKLAKARELLESTSFNINQVAEMLGYQNTETFLRLFKKATGTTPSVYRTQHASPLQSL